MREIQRVLRRRSVRKSGDRSILHPEKSGIKLEKWNKII